MKPNHPRLTRIGIAGLMSLVVFLLVCPQLRDPATPLPWDMAGHTMDAVELVDAVRGLHPVELARSLFGADLYPPGHSIGFGAWMLMLGESPLSLWFFRWVLLALSLLAVLELGRRSGVRSILGLLTAAAFGLASPFLLGLSASFLVEPFAVLVLLWTLVAMVDLDRAPTRVRTLMAGSLLGITLLTKYNVGLPLLPAMGILAVWRAREGDWRTARAWAIAAGTGAALWILFLSIQIHGWSSFLEFARNRGGTEAWSPLDRVIHYLRLHGNEGTPHPALALLQLVLLAGYLGKPRIRRGVLPLGLLYIAFTLAALSRHPYVLGRNLTAAMAVFSTLAAIGSGRLVEHLVLQNHTATPLRKSRVLLGSSLGVIALAAVALSIAPAQRHLLRLDPPELVEMASLSHALLDELARSDEVLVLGTFNEFSIGWVEILHRRNGSKVKLKLELPPVASRSRTRIDDQYLEEYRTALEQWRSGHPDASLFIIELGDGSRWNGDDYIRWNQWKRNWARAAKETGAPLAIQREWELENDLSVSVFAESDGELRFGEGWGPRYDWGRWAREAKAILRIAHDEEPRSLYLEFACFPEMEGEAQLCRVQAVGLSPIDWTIEGANWQWQTRVIELPAGFSGEITLEFETRWPTGGSGTLRALPFRLIEIREGGGILLADAS